MTVVLASVLVMGAGAYAFSDSRSEAEQPAPGITGLTQQVEGHEARITNTENDVKALQENTGTQPAPNPTPVPNYTPQLASPSQTAPSPPPTVTLSTTQPTTKKIVSVVNGGTSLTAVPTGSGWPSSFVECKYVWDNGTQSQESLPFTDTTPMCKPVGYEIAL